MSRSTHPGQLAWVLGPARAQTPTAVVVADADPSFRAELAGELLVHGCHVVEASDGAQLLEKLALAADGESAWPDVVVLNLRLPYLSGLNVLSVLWELPARPVTLLMTNLGDEAIASTAARFGARRVFRKPIDLDELVAAVVDSARRGRRSDPRN